MSRHLPLIQGRSLSRLHCVGVGGMGVGPLAIYLAGLGFSVSGEDDAMNEAMRGHLQRAGVRIGGMDADCECVVCSSAIAPTHPASEAARSAGIPIVRRGELLGSLLSSRKLVAVCGAHGKTTTTGMLITALRQAGLHPGYLLGGLFADDSLAPADAGEGEWVVAEVDESDGTISHFQPEITVLTNLDWDHPDHYRTVEQLNETFRDLFRRTRGTVLVSANCQHSAEIRGAAADARSFGPVGADYSYSLVEAGESVMRLQLSGRFPALGTLVRARGEFNAMNAAAALAAALCMGGELSEHSLARYPAVQRRQSVIPCDEAFSVIEDYAHHPAEISSLLGSLRPRLKAGKRLVVAFQPHRYSRTAQFRDDFVRALSLAHEAHLLSVYSAGEAPVPGGSSADLALAFPPDASLVYHGSDSDACFKLIGESLQPGDLLVILGAGDIDQKAKAWLKGRAWDRWAAKLRPLLSPETRFVREESLAQRTTMRVGGAARVYAEPCNEADLQILVTRSKADGVSLFMLGRGSNLLVPDEGVEGLVIALNHPFWSAFTPQADGRIWVGAGLRLKNLCGLAAKAGFHGFEFLEGIPGCVGGALRMNAGAMGGWTFDVVEEVRLLQADGRIVQLPKSAMDVDYRHCGGLDEAIALGAWLRPKANQDPEAVAAQIEAYRRKRQASQPREPSAGCIFKNPDGDSAGRLIDECGLKGQKVGDALVSPVHANFIVNTGSASASEVIALVRRVRAAVRLRKGIDLEPEVILYGKDWKSVL
jgi:UDP-N-acetylmuramate--L-alanine ligase/UDP-N-acetylenolpyruvoylglucosamine reductase